MASKVLLNDLEFLSLLMIRVNLLLFVHMGLIFGFSSL